MKRLYRYYFRLMRGTEFTKYGIYVDACNRDAAFAVVDTFVSCCCSGVTACFDYRESCFLALCTSGYIFTYE